MLRRLIFLVFSSCVCYNATQYWGDYYEKQNNAFFDGQPGNYFGFLRYYFFGPKYLEPYYGSKGHYGSWHYIYVWNERADGKSFRD